MSRVAESARRVAEVINESLKIAKESNNLDTKLSRLWVAEENLQIVKKLAVDYPFLTLESLQEVEQEITELKRNFEMAGYRFIAEGNAEGERLEKVGKVEEAICKYEELVEKGVDTPLTYPRLAILYRKQKQREDERRVVFAALNNVPSTNTKHFEWFEERLKKLNGK